MKRKWKPLDVGGLRLYRVVVVWPQSKQNPQSTRKDYIIAAQSPSNAAAIWGKLYAECIWTVEPIVKGFALNVCVPEDWDEKGVPCLECEPERWRR